MLLSQGRSSASGSLSKRRKDILNKNGILILSKGPGLEKELEGIDQNNISISDFKLPFENIIRHMVVVRVL